MQFKNCSFNQFAESLKDRNILLFGAGEYLSKTISMLKYFKLADRIEGIIDNNSILWGKIVSIENRSIKIDSVKNFEKYLQEKYVMVITTYEYFWPIIQQLKAYRMDCYNYSLMEEEQDILLSSNKLYLFKQYKKQQIPKVIHYFWFGKKKIPLEHQKYIESWKKYCPDYELVEWNESNYDITKIKYMQEAYICKRWGFVPDYARLDIIYQHGGIYMDTDVQVVRNLDELLFQKAYCGFQSGGLVNLGSGFGAKKNMPIIKKMMEAYQTVNFINGDGSHNLISSPTYQSDTLKTLGLKLDGQFQIIEDMAVYPTEVLCGLGARSGRNILTPNTFSFHQFSLSWANLERIQKHKEMLKYIKSVEL